MGNNGLARLLVGSAGGAVAEHAEQLARAIAARSGAELEVLGVETEGLPVPVAPGEPTRRCDSARPITWVRGVPGIEIVHRAKARGAGLVVLGRREGCPGGGLPLGHTADTVVRRHDGPCLLIPPTIERLDRMLLALDGTQRGLGLLESASRLAAVLGAQGTSVYVDPAAIPAAPVDSDWTDPATRRVQAALAGFPCLGGPEGLQIRSGAPVEAILRVLEESGANLLVIGVRRGGPSGDLGSGHVGRDLLRACPVAILTVPI